MATGTITKPPGVGTTFPKAEIQAKLKEVKAEDRPNTVLVHLAFQAMVAIGFGLRPSASGNSVAGRERCPSLMAEANELEEVDAVRIDEEPVTRRCRLERAFGQKLSQLRDVDLDRVPRCLGRVLSPQGVDQAVARDDAIRAHE